MVPRRNCNSIFERMHHGELVVGNPQGTACGHMVGMFATCA